MDGWVGGWVRREVRRSRGLDRRRNRGMGGRQALCMPHWREKEGLGGWAREWREG